MLNLKKLCCLLAIMALLIVTGCNGKNDVNDHAESKTTKHTDQISEIKSNTEQMLSTVKELKAAVGDQNVDQVKQLGKTLNDQWLAFENDVRDAFPLLYTKVEKYEQPIFAQASVDAPDLSVVKTQIAGLTDALNELKSAKLTKQNTTKLLDQAVKDYKDYVKTQADKLIEATTAFTDAVKAGNIDLAKQKYVDARVYYERIEPIAESFGDLDPKIDARINDVDDPSQWSGFHRLEKALWVDHSLKGMNPVADQLFEDVKALNEKIANLELKPQQIVAGSMELLNEAAISKITGEEEHYSHIDLVDLAANVEGSEAVYHAIIPALEDKNKSLAQKLDEQFLLMKQTLQKYKKNDQYVNYTTLNKDEIRELSNQLATLSKLMSQTAEIF
ncbi:iron uptake system protein EfeO [Tuberibacillus calidus]|mgnify:CR=1 FL=1|jgi:iron uptake system component EfeO|uniref:iron uptake system protein EfeO n=1 Tax=Tuberibacillus calidus TaxID=340097 RepID=UPI00041D96C4|nr:iron uptake system protein EfeO [Tuberibacillus calidus]